MHWKTYLCTEKYIRALKNIFVHWETYLCTGKHIGALKNIFLHWETYLCTEKHICALKIYICALKNMSVMCSDQYICTEIFICALHIWATVSVRSVALLLQARRKTREETGGEAKRKGPFLFLFPPLPTLPPLVRSSFPLSLGYFARLRDYLEKDC